MKWPSVSAVLLVALLSAAAFPYGLQYGREKDDVPLKWNASRIAVSVSVSLSEAVGFKGSDEILPTLRSAAQAWHRAGAPEIVFHQSSLDTVSPAGRSGDGISLITLASTPENVLLFSGENASRPAVTRLFYDQHGYITEADIVLNPYYPHSSNGLPGSFDVETTMVHELGHLFGLGHSELPGASMYELGARNGLYGMPFSMLRTLSEDDVAGIRALYGNGSAGRDCCEEIVGLIPVGGRPVGEWLVWGESISSGAVEGSVAAASDGSFRLAGMPREPLRLFARNSGGKGAFAIDLGVYDPETKVFTAAEVSGPEFGGFARIDGAGINGELSGLAVPVNPGHTYRLYLAVRGWAKRSGVNISSPEIEVDKTSFEIFDYGDGLAVVSFLVVVGENVEEGLYSIGLQVGEETVDLLPGVISVGPESNPWVFHPAANKSGESPE